MTMPRNLRLTFMIWLRDKVFKVPEATVGPKILQYIYNTLFPLRAFYLNQSGIRYDVCKNIYYINGYEFTGEFIKRIGEMGRAPAKTGELYREEMAIIIGGPTSLFKGSFLHHASLKVDHGLIHFDPETKVDPIATYTVITPEIVASVEGLIPPPKPDTATDADDVADETNEHF